MTGTATRTASGIGPSLADPQTCGEDLSANLREVSAIATAHCPGCGDYHIAHCAKRLTGRSVWPHGGRESLLNTLRPIVDGLAARNSAPVDIVVAACADTAVVSTAAHTVYRAGPAFLDRSRFFVADRCPTPLRLCENYGLRHGLAIGTEAMDLTGQCREVPADLILLHNFLSYVPEESHAKLLQNLSSWLKPGARIVIWNNLVTDANRDLFHLFLRMQIEDVKAMIDRIEIGESKESLIDRLERTFARARQSTHRVADTETVTALLATAGLDVLSTEEMFPLGLLPDPSAVSFPCATIVAGKKG